MKKNIKGKSRGLKFFSLKNKRAYIALLVLLVLVGVSVTVRNRAMKSMESQMTFDDEAWREAVKESGVIFPEEKEPEAEPEPESETEAEVKVTEVSSSPAFEDAVEYGDEYSEAFEEPLEVSSFEEDINFMRPSTGSVLKAFSGDELVYCEEMEDWRTHNGIDFAAEEGDQVIAAADGVVRRVEKDDMLGITVEIEHPDGTLSRYSGLQSLDFINEGKTVTAGDIIGGVGKAGFLEEESQPHLHFEIIKNGEYEDPDNYFAK